VAGDPCRVGGMAQQSGADASRSPRDLTTSPTDGGRSPVGPGFDWAPVGPCPRSGPGVHSPPQHNPRSRSGHRHLGGRGDLQCRVGSPQRHAISLRLELGYGRRRWICAVAGECGRRST
jgi:hypothetical protein